MSKARELAELGAVYDTGALSFRNMLTNGRMTTAQRGTSFATAATGIFALDRIKYEKSGVSTVVTISQDSGLAGVSPKSLKFEVTTAGSATPSASHFHQFIYKVEGTYIDHVGLGTSDCLPMVFSFYAKASTTGTLPFSLHNDAGTVVYSSTYNISTANTWQRHTFKLPAITSGSFSSGTSSSLAIRFGLEYGSDYTGGTPDQWRAISPGFTGGGGFQSAYTNALGSTVNATLNLTGFQLEIGTEATKVEQEPDAVTRLKCQRYFVKGFLDSETPGTDSAGSASYTATCWNDGNAPTPFLYTPMRAAPTVVLYNGTTAGQIGQSSGGKTASAADITTRGPRYLSVTSGVAGSYCYYGWTMDAEI